MAINYKMTRKGITYNCEVLKKAILSTGATIYLLRRECSSPKSNPYVVGVRKDDETLEFMTFLNLPRACCYYIDMLACYA